jgi:murein DD-endopeptidase MepM/ murein hydrolase activator NlpD
VGVKADDGLSSFARDLADALRRGGIEVTTGPGATSPDVVLYLIAGAGQAAWYCDWPGSGSAALASSLAGALTQASSAAPPFGFDCDALQTAGARVPATLVRLPSGAVEGRALAQSLARSVATYLDRYGATQRRWRDGARLAWPAAGGITSPYGPEHPLGIDIGQWTGPIRAAADGTVYFAGGNACCSYGLFVVIDSSSGIRTLYGHLESLTVKTGDRVKAGQILGQVGCTGACSGPHLHFEVFDSGVRRNPLAYLGN